MELPLISSSQNGQAFPVRNKGQGAAPAAPQAKNAEVDPVVVHQQVKDAHTAEKQRLDTVIRAAQLFKDVYAVSDTSFSIFKDASGQFITRFTSLKDGSITYIPEPDMVQYINPSAGMVEIEA
jgi:hypothetical protein